MAYPLETYYVEFIYVYEEEDLGYYSSPKKTGQKKCYSSASLQI